MFRNLGIIALLIILTLIGIHWVLDGHRLLSLAEKLPGPLTAPTVDFYVGDLYYTCRDFVNAKTYFRYGIDRFPDSPYAEESHWLWLESLQNGFLGSPAQMAAECQAFLKQYPSSPYAADVRKLATTSAGAMYGELQNSGK